MKVFKIIELSQGSDYHGAHHWIHDDVVALCESKLAAEQHIEEQREYKETPRHENLKDYSSSPYYPF